MKSITQLLKENNALWGIIAFLILTVIPAATALPEPFLKISMSIGTSLFIALTISHLVNKKIAASTNYEVRGLISNHFPKLLEMEKFGLDRIVYSNDMESLGIDLVGPTELYVAMNDGKNFFTNNSKKLSERFKKENKRTYIILLSDTSKSEEIMNNKNMKTEQGYYGRKIRESINDYIEFHKGSPESNTLQIYKYDYHLAMSIVATDMKAIVGMYRNAASKAIAPPQFIFTNTGNDCEYSNIKKDLEGLMKRSILTTSDANKKTINNLESAYQQTTASASSTHLSEGALYK